MIKLIVSPLNGFCPGVKNAVALAKKHASPDTYCLGEISHNERVLEELKALGIKFVDTPAQIQDQGAKIIIRAHGEGRATYEALRAKNAEIIDATCPAVSRVHKLVSEYCSKGYKIIIVGDKEHPEVKGICGWCINPIVAADENYDFSVLKSYEKVCVVAQTTFPVEKYHQIVEKITKQQLKTVEIFDTICYTTSTGQKLAEKIAEKSSLVLVVGSKKSSNTRKLAEAAARHARTFLISSAAELQNIEIMPGMTVGLLAGASTPEESIREVEDYMAQNMDEVTVSEELKAGVEESMMTYREGQRVKGTVISADDKGIRVNIGGKYDGIIYAAEAGIEKEYDPEDYPAGAEIDAMITGKKDSEMDCIPLSKRKVDLIKEGDKVIESIRGGEAFELLATSATKGGLLGKLGTYTVFIPSSQIKEKGFPKDLNVFVKKKMRLTALEIDDQKRKIVASQKKILTQEREEREGIFWTHVKPNVIVNGTVKRITNFGAFVSVDNFDCLAHIVDLSWNHIKNVEEVLEKDKSYDFLVLSVDREKGRVSLGYKQLQPHPYTVALQRHPIGSICKGKVVSLVPFGAFVQIEPGIEGLVHVSEAAHNYVKNINEVIKVGEEVDVMVLAVDEASRRITLSIKACLTEDAPQEAPEEERRPRGKGRGKSEPVEQKGWNDDNSNNPFADLLKGVEVK